MAWVRFLVDMDWKPRPAITIAYRAGMVRNVPRSATNAAIAAGKAVAMRKMSRHEEPIDEKA